MVYILDYRWNVPLHWIEKCKGSFAWMSDWLAYVRLDERHAVIVPESKTSNHGLPRAMRETSSRPS